MIEIAIPSANRPDRVSAANAVPRHRVSVVVPDSQADAYEKANPDLRIVAHPDSVPTLSAKRQWIYEKFGSVIMIDDDVNQFVNLEVLPTEPLRKLTPEEGGELCDRLADESDDMGVKLFGINESADPRFFHGHHPYRLTGWVNGPFMGMHSPSKLVFHPGLKSGSDYWVSALNAHYYRKVLVDRRYVHTFKSNAGIAKNVGGMAMHRSQESEAETSRILKEWFGDVIGGKSGSGPVLFGSHRSLQVPWK